MAEAFYIDDEPIPTDLVVERRPRTVMVPVGPNSKEALAIKSSGDSRPIKSIARALRRNRNYHASN
jgi:hypothetical protein